MLRGKVYVKDGIITARASRRIILGRPRLTEHESRTVAGRLPVHLLAICALPVRARGVLVETFREARECSATVRGETVGDPEQAPPLPTRPGARAAGGQLGVSDAHRHGRGDVHTMKHHGPGTGAPARRIPGHVDGVAPRRHPFRRTSSAARRRRRTVRRPAGSRSGLRRPRPTVPESGDLLGRDHPVPRGGRTSPSPRRTRTGRPRPPSPHQGRHRHHYAVQHQVADE